MRVSSSCTDEVLPACTQSSKVRSHVDHGEGKDRLGPGTLDDLVSRGTTLAVGADGFDIWYIVCIPESSAPGIGMILMDT